MYHFDDIEPDEVPYAELFNALRTGDVINLEDTDWRVTVTRKVSSEPYVRQIRLVPLDADEVPLSACVDYRCSATGTAPEFRVKNAEGEWGYEDVEADLFALVSMTERSVENRAVEGKRYYDAILEDVFDVLDVGEYEVAIEYRNAPVTVDSVPRIVFPKRRELMRYQTLGTE